MEVRPSASLADTNADTTRLRHARLRERRLLDAGPDSSFDDLAHLAALICGTSRASKMRTLLMTGNADAVPRHDDIAERSVVRKPFGMKTLQHAVDAALAQP